MFIFKNKGLRSIAQEVLKTFFTLGSWKKKNNANLKEVERRK